MGYVDGSHSMYQVMDLWEGCNGPVGRALTNESLGCTEVHVNACSWSRSVRPVGVVMCTPCTDLRVCGRHCGALLSTV